jgi:hypothetical protein
MVLCPHTTKSGDIIFVITVRIHTGLEMRPGWYSLWKRCACVIYVSSSIFACQSCWTPRAVIIWCISTIKHDTTASTCSPSRKSNAFAPCLYRSATITVLWFCTAAFYWMRPRPVSHRIITRCMINNSFLSPEGIFPIRSIVNQRFQLDSNTRGRRLL